MKRRTVNKIHNAIAAFFVWAVIMAMFLLFSWGAGKSFDVSVERNLLGLLMVHTYYLLYVLAEES